MTQPELPQTVTASMSKRPPHTANLTALTGGEAAEAPNQISECLARG
jgi:hypothetical protein